MTATMPPDDESRPDDGFNADVRDALERLDGTPESAVSLLTGVPVDELEQYGGMP